MRPFQKEQLKRNVKQWLKRPKKTRKLSPLSVPPKGAESRYSLLLRTEVQRLKRLILQELSHLSLGNTRTDAEDDPIKGVESTIQRLRRELTPRVSTRQINTVFGDVNTANMRSMNAVLIGPTAGIPIWTDTSAKSQIILTRAMRDNVRLIKTIPSQMLDRVEATLTEALKSGSDVSDLSSMLQEDFDISDRRADLIARDQVLKVNGQLVEQRSSEAGITGYIWDTSKDVRVRPMHRDLDGTRHTWDNPPVTNEQGDRNHPGGDFQCRCAALPDINSLLNSLESDS